LVQNDKVIGKGLGSIKMRQAGQKATSIKGTQMIERKGPEVKFMVSKGH
jgi:hypothetical protein